MLAPARAHADARAQASLGGPAQRISASSRPVCELRAVGFFHTALRGGFLHRSFARRERPAHAHSAGSEGAARYNIAMTRKTRIQPIEPAAPEVDENGYDRPSKSQLKREMHELQELGSALIALPKDALKRMPMPEKLDDAVREARRITDHEGKRRQVQYVGRVMRSLLDEETAALRTALDTYNGVNKAETAKLHWIERTREKLLADDAALTEFIRQHPNADPQQGRTLIRNARKEAQQSKPPRYFRELFQWIKNADGPSAQSDADADHAPEDDDDERDE
jgi:ribosome-associated protein